MNKTLLRLPILLVILTLLLNQPKAGVLTQPRLAASGEQTVRNAEIAQTVEAKQLDERAVILQAYLAKHNAPLQYHAQDFVEAADLYNLDWKFVAAISGVESTFGKHVPGGTDPEFSSFNGWGWGVYGDKSLGFDSWRDGIFTVSKGLRENYFDKGLTEPYAINKKYAASQSWGKNVTFFLNDISEFEAEFKAKNPS
jgi:hypothetical protein